MPSALPAQIQPEQPPHIVAPSLPFQISELHVSTRSQFGSIISTHISFTICKHCSHRVELFGLQLALEITDHLARPLWKKQSMPRKAVESLFQDWARHLVSDELTQPTPGPGPGPENSTFGSLEPCPVSDIRLNIWGTSSGCWCSPKNCPFGLPD